MELNTLKTSADAMLMAFSGAQSTKGYTAYKKWRGQLSKAEHAIENAPDEKVTIWDSMKKQRGVK